MFSVMWSEHCSYKSSRVHLKTLPTEGPRVLQGPGENAGAVDIGDGLAAVFKIESHNHPSFIEPYQGAATGVGGIIRDIFTMGARPIALLDSLRFGPLDEPANRRIVKGVVAGHRRLRQLHRHSDDRRRGLFDECYAGNPLVNVFCLGIARREALVRGRASGLGNPVYYVGRQDGPRRHPWGDDGVAPSSTTSRQRSVRPCRWAIRSWRSCCSRRASRSWPPTRSSASRTWARPA